MQVMISGAAGFLGRHFHDFYRKQAGVEVVAFDIAAERPEGVLRFDAEEFYNSSGRTFDLAIHLAAFVGGREVIENDPLKQTRNAALDAAFFRWAVGHTAQAVYPSSSAVYGIRYQTGDGTQLAESMFHPSQTEWAAPDSWYGTEKLLGEYLAWTAAEKYDLNTLVIRPFSGYGEGQADTYPVPAICARALAKENPLVIWGSGRQSRDFIHVDDLVSATAARLEAKPQGYVAMNIGTGVPITFAEIARMAADIVGYHPGIVTDESKPQGVQARYCDPSEMLKWYRPRVTVYDGLRKVLNSLSRAHAA